MVADVLVQDKLTGPMGVAQALFACILSVTLVAVVGISVKRMLLGADSLGTEGALRSRIIFATDVVAGSTVVVEFASQRVPVGSTKEIKPFQLDPIKPVHWIWQE